MKAPISFAYCVFAAVVFGFLIGVSDARIPVARCNHDEKQSMVNRLSTRAAQQTQDYVNPDTNSIVVGPIRIKTVPYYPGTDSVRGEMMSCDKEGTEIIANGKYYTCTSSDVLTDSKDQFISGVLKDVVKELSYMFSVNQPQKLVIDKTVYGSLDYLSGNCDNTDLVVAITYRPDSWDVYASGTSLVYDQYGRPILGQFNVNPRSIDTTISKKFYKNVFIHELFHILGFSQNRMLAFHNMSTLNETTGEIEAYPDLQLIGTESDGREITLLASPKVTETFRKHVGCDTAEGALLEDQGGSNVAGSHWEMTNFMDELMTATVSERSILSEVTLSVFEDSGWYYVNYSSATHFWWGYQKGCDFVYKRCNSSWPIGNGYFCPYDSRGTEDCTYDRRGIGTCDFRYWVNIPEKYRYFPDEHIGGPVEYADYCPFTYASFFCDESAKSAETSSYGDASGDKSRCFRSTLTDSPDSTTKQPEAPKCYPRHCITNETYAVKIGSYWYPCPAGGNITEVISFSGVLQCPDAALLCTGEVIDDRFPIFISIEPKSAVPGTSIRINGKHLTDTCSVSLGVPCGNVTRNGDGSINCTISADSQYSAEQGTKNLIIKQNGFSLAVPNAFYLEIGVTNWILKNWFFSVCLAIAAVVLLLTILIVCCKCCSTQRRWNAYQRSKGKAAKKKQAAASGGSNEFGNDVEFEDL